MVTSFQLRQTRRDAVNGLPEDMSFIKSELERLKEHTGLPDAKTNVDEETGSTS